MWYIIPLIICLLGGMFIPNIVISVVCIVYTIAYILELTE